VQARPAVPPHVLVIFASFQGDQIERK
jgi:hypothetical protein